MEVSCELLPYSKPYLKYLVFKSRLFIIFIFRNTFLKDKLNRQVKLLIHCLTLLALFSLNYKWNEKSFGNFS